MEAKDVQPVSKGSVSSNQNGLIDVTPDLVKISGLCDSINKTLESVVFTPHWSSEMFGLYLLDNLYLRELSLLLNEAVESSQFPYQAKIAELLSFRWVDMCNTPFCYTLCHGQEYPYKMISNIFVNIARIMFAEQANKFLMPTLEDSDIISNELSELYHNEFITLCNNHRITQFIHIPSLLDTAIQRFDQREQECLITWDSGVNQTRELNQAEVANLLTAHPFLSSFVELLNRENVSAHYTIREQLQKLRNGLRAGGQSREGTELNSGLSANTAIVNFTSFFNGLPIHIQLQVHELSGPKKSFSVIYSDLTSPVDMDVTTCVELNADYIDDILSNPANQEILAASLEVNEAKVKLEDIKENFDLLLKAAQPTLYDIKVDAEGGFSTKENNNFERSNWLRYQLRLKKVIVWDMEYESSAILFLKSCILKMELFFPRRALKRKEWANMFLMLQHAVFVLQGIPEQRRVEYIWEVWRRLKCLAHNFNENGEQFSAVLDELYAAFLNQPVKSLIFNLPKDYRDLLAQQCCVVQALGDLDQVEVVIQATVPLEGARALYISRYGQEELENLGELKVKRMSYHANIGWSYLVLKTMLNDTGVKLWLGQDGLEAKSTNSRMLGFFNVPDPKQSKYEIDSANAFVSTRK